MTKNPFVNALAALLYIVIVVSAIFYSGSLFGEAQNTILIPMAMLSLFVLSASIMGYIFLYNPVVMFLEGSKKEGVTLFLTTVAVFAVLTAALFVLQLVAAR